MKRLILIVACLLCAGMLRAQVRVSGTVTIAGPTNLAVAPSDTATYPNLQALGSAGWTVLYGTSCCGGSNSGTGTGAWGIASPSLSGGSMSLTNVYTGSAGNGLNSQMYTVLNCSILSGGSCLSANNIKAEVHFYIPSTSASPQALEGPNVVLYDGTDQEYPSLQCNSVGGHWWVWNSGGATWVDTGNSCSAALTTNTWHDLVANYEVDGVAHTLRYVSATLDGTSIGALGQSYSGEPDVTAVALKAQVQLDGNEAGPATTAVNYDRYDVTVTTNPASGATPVLETNNYRVGDNALTVPQGGTTVNSITLPQELNFYAQGTNTSSMAIPISISNCYNPQYAATFGECGTVEGSFTVTGMTITGTNASDFTLSGTCGTIASGSDCEPAITFTPTASAGTTENATLTVTYSGASVSSQTLPLTGVSQTVTDISTSSCPTALAASTYYQLTADITCAGTAFTLNGEGISVNLNGHTVTYGNTSSASMVNGFLAELGTATIQATIYNGTITEGAGTNTYGAAIPESGAIGYTGNVYGFDTGNIFANLALTTKAQYSHAIQMSGGSADIHDVVMNLNGVGNCATIGCRAEMQGSAFYQENATSSTGLTIYNNAQNGGPQGGLVPESAGLIAYNSLNPGNATGTNANNFAIVGYCDTCTFADNSIMTPMNSASATRGILISGATSEGENIDVTDNIIGAFDNATSTEYSGCQGGGVYGLQIDDNPTGPNGSSGNYIHVWSKACMSSGLRITDTETTNNTGTDDTYAASHLSGFTTCVFNVDTAATGGCAVGTSIDGPTGYGNTGSSFAGDDADVLFDITGASGVTFHSPTFVKPTTAASGFHTFVAVTGTPSQGGGSVTNVHFIDPTYDAGTSPTDLDVPAQDPTTPNMGAVTFYPADWTQTMQVNKASGPAVNGAVVTWTDTDSNAYTCTTNSSGTCTVVLSQYEDGNMTGANQANSLNPYSLSVTASGCTTDSESGLTITAKGTKTVSLSGC